MSNITREEALANLKDWIARSQGSIELTRMQGGDQEARGRDAQLLIGRYLTGSPAFAGVVADIVVTGPQGQDEFSALADALSEMKVEDVNADVATSSSDESEKAEVAA